MLKAMMKKLHGRRGQGVTEYALVLAAIILLVGVLSMSDIATEIGNIITELVTALQAR